MSFTCRCNTRLNCRSSRGLSLLEVMLALAILGGALAVLGQLIRIGSLSAAAARDSTTAQLLAESKMAEIASGIILSENQFQQPMDDEGEWLCSVETEEIDQQGLLAVRVTVEQNYETNSKPTMFSLTRWIVDPEVDAAARLATAEIKKSAGANANQGQAAAGEPSAAAAMGGGIPGGGFPGAGGGFPSAGGATGAGGPGGGLPGAGGGFPGGGFPGAGGPGGGFPGGGGPGGGQPGGGPRGGGGNQGGPRGGGGGIRGGFGGR